MGESKPTSPMDVEVILNDTLGKPLSKKLTVEPHPEHADTHVIITPQGFLGKPNWIQVMNVVKGLGGEWVKAGKKGYWQVPLGDVEAKERVDPYKRVDNHLKAIRTAAQRILDEIAEM